MDLSTPRHNLLRNLNYRSAPFHTKIIYLSFQYEWNKNICLMKNSKKYHIHSIHHIHQIKLSNTLSNAGIREEVFKSKWRDLPSSLWNFLKYIFYFLLATVAISFTFMLKIMFIFMVTFIKVLKIYQKQNFKTNINFIYTARSRSNGSRLETGLVPRRRSRRLKKRNIQYKKQISHIPYKCHAARSLFTVKSISDLPNELTIKIFSYFNAKELLSLRSVSPVFFVFFFIFIVNPILNFF